MENNCIFCKIINKEINSKILYEEKDFIIINDIHPKAKKHYLIIPKVHYPLFANQTENDMKILGEILNKLPQLEKILNIEKGYSITINQKEGGGQTVSHLHIHVMSNV